MTTDPIQLDAFHILLAVLANSLDIRDVIQHLSAVASTIHDGLFEPSGATMGCISR